MFKKLHFVIFLVISVFAFGDSRYVHKVMQDILKAHIEHKQVTPNLLRRAVRICFDQFDPHRIYLLQEEVDQLLQLNEQDVSAITQAYLQGDFSYFKTVYQHFSKAILRARANRRDLDGLKLSVRRVQNQSHSNFPASEAELMQRQKHHMQVFVQSMGKKKNRAKVLHLYEKKQRFHESNFLEMNTQAFGYRILKALSRSLDPHTLYYLPDEAAEIRNYLEKGYLGIGIIFKENEEGIFVKEVMKDSPAQKADKIKQKDRLIKVMNQPVENLTLEEVSRVIKSAPNNVLFEFAGANEIYTVDLIKEKLEVNEERIEVSFESYQEGILGRIKLFSFYESQGISAEIDIKRALRQLKSKGDLKGLILDLRDNPGGFLTQAVKVAGLFLKNGVVVVCRYGSEEKRFLREMDGRVFYEGPLVVLTSKGSASAAEIVAGTLQDYGVGVVVGDPTTFGKATIQYQNITNRSGPSYKVTIGRYYTVSGKSPQLHGVQADIVAPSWLYHHNIGEKFLHYPLGPDQIEPVFKDPLADVHQKDRAWFDENYIPKMQKQRSFYTQILPQLKQRSEERLQHHPVYQEFIESQGKYTDLEFYKHDYQLTEAFEVLKDIVEFQSTIQAKAA